MAADAETLYPVEWSDVPVTLEEKQDFESFCRTVIQVIDQNKEDRAHASEELDVCFLAHVCISRMQTELLERLSQFRDANAGVPISVAIKATGAMMRLLDLRDTVKRTEARIIHRFESGRE